MKTLPYIDLILNSQATRAQSKSDSCPQTPVTENEEEFIIRTL